MQGQHGADGDAQVDQINGIVDRITRNIAEPISMQEVAAELGMSESRFSRFFRRATGNSFTDFVNRVRINSACHLLMQTEPLRDRHLPPGRLQQRGQFQPALPGRSRA